MLTILRNYYRLTKPGIVYGNSLSVIAGFFLAAKGDIDPGLLIVTLLGIAGIMAGACVYNNYLDQGIDARMDRTKRRALVTGLVPGWSALLFATVLAAVGFTLLAAFTNAITVVLGLIAIVMYVVVYGVAKRTSPFGTIVGSVAGALPPAAGYTVVSGQFDGGAWLLLLIMTCWQMPHFYAIAIYRIKDYRAAGLPVLPAKRGISRTKASIIAYIAVYLVLAALPTVFGYTGLLYLMLMIIFSSLWLIQGILQYRTLDDTTWARRMFLFSLKVLLAWVLAIVADSFLKLTIS